MRIAVFLTIAFLCCFFRSAWAGTQDAAVVALHCPTVIIKGDPCVAGLVLLEPCSDLDVQQIPMSALHVWLIVARADDVEGVSGLSCGVVTTDLLEVANWHLCAGNEVPKSYWPQSGGGNRITWDPLVNCQRETLGTDGVHALAGSFYVYAYGDAYLEITPNEAEGETAIVVTDCAGTTSELTTPGGRIGFGNVEGYNPCAEDVPVVPKTWGSIKQHYTD